MYNTKEKRRIIRRNNSFLCTYYLIILVTLGSCAPKTHQIVYFKEPKYKGYETSKSHKHGKLHRPNFIPIRDHYISHEIVEKYNSMYKKKHDVKDRKSSFFDWLVIFLISVGIISGVSLLI